MTTENKDLDETLDHSERIAVVGSPSTTTDLNLDVLGSAAEKKLIGSFGVIKYPQDGQNHYALGQITEISMQNIWSQDPTMRSLIRQKGRVDPITGKQDTHRAKMMISSVFANTGSEIEPSVLGTVPSTGTSVRLIDDLILKKMLAVYEKEIFYLGNIYGNNVLLPTWFKHFEKGDGGLGEAYHLGVFGKTGSGKSVLAKMILGGYGKHKQMSMFIMDPQGEFSKDLKEDSPLKKILTDKLNRKIHIINLHNLVLSGFSLFEKILMESLLFMKLGIINKENQGRAATAFVSKLKNLNCKPFKAYERTYFDEIIKSFHDNNFLAKIYSGKPYQERMKSSLESIDIEELYKDWEAVCKLFSYDGKKDAKIIRDLLDELFKEEETEKTIVVIDLSSSEIPENIFWNEDIKKVVIKEFLAILTEKAEEKYKQDKNLNTLVVIDEAHRLAPREVTDNPQSEELKSVLIDAIRTTRKYGLGWMFISQTLSSLHKELLNQIRIFMFGFGLGWGSELRALEELIGGNKESINLYQSFKDPQSGLGKKEYPFMCVGPLSPLSFSSTPLFFNALDYASKFTEVNFPEIKKSSRA